MNTVEEILRWVELHHERYPEHGLNCACMDEAIRSLRKLLKTDKTINYQLRINYVLRQAIERL